MLENPAAAAPSDATATATVKRYAPPNQRNRSLNRPKSGGDRLDRANSVYTHDGEKNQQTPASSRTISVVDHGDVGCSNFLNDNSRPSLIPLEGCCCSEAAQLLNDRWATVMHNYNDTLIDLSERPVMYSGGSASAWAHPKLPHQIMSPANSAGAPGPQMDFLSELRRAIHNAGAGFEN